jgi:hypothetical protein
MEFFDKNQSWLPPDGYMFQSLLVDGAYLQIFYQQNIFKTGTTQVIATNRVIVYVNDQGREVARTTRRIDVPQPAAPSPKKWWEKLIDLLP